MQKPFHRPRAQTVEPILKRDTPTDTYSCRVVPFGGQDTIFSHLHPQNPQKTIFGTCNGMPMGSTYSHNCMMHRDTMLKFDLANTWSTHKSFSIQGTARGGAVARTLHFGTPYLSLKLIELGS